MRESLLIFLDFDGVLRRQDAPLYRFEKPLRLAFEDAVRRISAAEIVVSSTWREVAGLTDLRKLFSRDVAERMVGVTPIGEGGRYQEVLTYLRATGAEGRRFVVVDDDPRASRAECRYSSLTRRRGLVRKRRRDWWRWRRTRRRSPRAYGRGGFSTSASCRGVGHVKEAGQLRNTTDPG